MGRSKHRKKTQTRTQAPPVNGSAPAPSTAAQPPTVVTVEDLLVQAAQCIGSLEYQTAKQLCVQAVQLAHKEAQDKPGETDPRMLRDALEILGTVELEMDEVEEAREVRTVSSLPGKSLEPN